MGSMGLSEEGITSAHLRMDAREAMADSFREFTDATLEAVRAGKGVVEPARRFIEFTDALTCSELRDVASVFLGRLKGAERRIEEMES